MSSSNDTDISSISPHSPLSQHNLKSNSSISLHSNSSISGYPFHMFVTPPPDELKCSICMKILRDPVQVCGQQHVYCSGCIYHWKEMNSRCPQCRAPFSLEQPARLARNIILQLRVRCPEACKWTGQLKDLNAHVATCPFVLISCPFAEVGCGFQAERRNMGAHCSDQAAHLLMLTTSFAALKAECATKK
ncbi:hypothetical protein B484DRAFT_461762, partial [Ochromonadaceae sp. CCMP2298]